MKIYKMFLKLLFFTAFIPLFGQKNDIYSVKFNFFHSKRIPDNHVSVEFERSGDKIQVSIKSIPKDSVSLEWKKSKRKNSFELSLIEFNKVVAAIKKINCSDIVNNLGNSGFDGTDCEIVMGGLRSSISYNVWSPNYDTKERNLQSFLEACKLILLTAKLDPNKIL
jgi:hypothetical protein